MAFGRCMLALDVCCSFGRVICVNGSPRFFPFFFAVDGLQLLPRLVFPLAPLLLQVNRCMAAMAKVRKAHVKAGVPVNSGTC